MANNPGHNSQKTPQESTVLIVSNDETLWELLHYIVRKEGFLIEKADTGSESVSKAKILRPELIIMGLKAQDSYETLRELQTDDAMEIPIILLSERHLDQATLDLIKLEPNVKAVTGIPIDAQALTSLLHMILKTRAL